MRTKAEMNDTSLKRHVDLLARLDAHQNLRSEPQLNDNSYETLMALIGRENPEDHENFTEDELHLLRLLAGPHGRTVVKMLLARKTASLKPV